MLWWFALSAAAEPGDTVDRLATASRADRAGVLRSAIGAASDSAERLRLLQLSQVLARIAPELTLTPDEVRSVAAAALSADPALQAEVPARVAAAVASAEARRSEEDAAWNGWAAALAPLVAAATEPGVARKVLDDAESAVPEGDPRREAIAAAMRVLDRFPPPWSKPPNALISDALGPRASTRQKALRSLEGVEGIGQLPSIYGLEPATVLQRHRLAVHAVYWYQCSVDSGRPRWESVEEVPGPLRARGAAEKWAERECSDGVEVFEDGWTIADGRTIYVDVEALGEAFLPPPPSLCAADEPTSTTISYPVPGVFYADWVQQEVPLPWPRIADCTPVAAAEGWVADFNTALERRFGSR